MKTILRQLNPITPPTFELKVIMSIVLLAIFSRTTILPLFDHIPNVSASDALALFCGTFFHRRIIAFIVVIFSIGVGDMIIHKWTMGQVDFFYPGFYWQYGSYILITILGGTLKNNMSPLRLLVITVISSMLFFILSNFGTWLSGYLYSMSLNGLITCYVEAIPFLKNTLVGDIFFSAVLFGSCKFTINCRRNNELLEGCKKE